VAGCPHSHLVQTDWPTGFLYPPYVILDGTPLPYPYSFLCDPEGRPLGLALLALP